MLLSLIHVYQNEVFDVSVLVRLDAGLYLRVGREHKHQPVNNIPRGSKMLIISIFCYEPVLKIGIGAI